MAKAKITSITILEKHQCLDGNVDHLMRLSFDDDTQLLLPLRLTESQAYSFTLQEDKKQRELQQRWVNIPKKRTAQANARALYKLHPDIALNNTGNFYRLTEDDRKRRQKAKLAKRQWKVHEIATFANGFFVARLSCSRQEKTTHEHHQYILYPSMWSDLRSNDQLLKWDVYSQHGGFISSVKINARRLRYALREHNWHLLSQLLDEVERGYNTELEAKSGLEHVVGKQDASPIHRQSFGKPNSVRQVHSNDNIVIAFLDEYQGTNNKSWFFKVNEGADGKDRFYLMEMDRNTAGKVQLKNSSVSTAFENAEQAAKQLVSQDIAQCQAIYLTSGKSLVECQKLWQTMIEWDVDHRYFREQLTATWLVTDVFMKDEQPVGCLAQCFYETSLYLPIGTKPLPYRALVIENDKIIDLSRLDEGHYHMRQDCEKFRTSLSEEDNTLSRELPRDLIEILQYSRGFAQAQQAKNALEASLAYDKSINLNGGACALNAAQQRASFIYRHEKQRADIIERIGSGRITEEVLVRFDEQVKTKQHFPAKLIDLLVESALLSLDDADATLRCKREYSDVLSVDECKAMPLDAKNPILNTTKAEVKGRSVCSPPVINIKVEGLMPWQKSTFPSTELRHKKRKNKYENDAERKRIWAQKNRAEIKAEQLALGVTPANVGRKKRHDSPAARQKAYLLKKKWSLLATDACFIVCDAHLLLGNATLMKAIDVIMPLFAARGLIIVKDENQTNKLLAALPSVTPNNVYINTSIELSKTIISQMNAGGSKTAYFCGANVTTSCYLNALALHERGMSICLQPKLCVEVFKGELALAKPLFANALK